MKSIYRKAYKALEKMGVPVYEHVDDNGNFSIDAERGDDWVNQYEPSFVFGVHPALEDELRKHGLFCEWVNAGRLSVYPA